MTSAAASAILEETRAHLQRIIEQEHLLDTLVSVRVKPLTPEEAIGAPERRDFPIIIGKERVIEASVLGARGQAFSDSPSEFAGTVAEVLRLCLDSSHRRAIFVAVLNALFRHLYRVTATVHCKDEDPELCAREIAGSLLARFGRARVGLVGLNPAIAERLVETFGAQRTRITDLSRDNIGKLRFGVEIWDGGERTDEIIDASDVLLVTGTTLVNATFEEIHGRALAAGKPCIPYGVTAAGVCELMGFERLCPRGQDG